MPDRSSPFTGKFHQGASASAGLMTSSDHSSSTSVKGTGRLNDRYSTLLSSNLSHQHHSNACHNDRSIAKHHVYELRETEATALEALQGRLMSDPARRLILVCGSGRSGLRPQRIQTVVNRGDQGSYRNTMRLHRMINPDFPCG